jgi:hypothetical protein
VADPKQLKTIYINYDRYKLLTSGENHCIHLQGRRGSNGDKKKEKGR